MVAVSSWCWRADGTWYYFLPFFALLWLGAAIMVGYTIYDCRDMIGWGITCLLGISIVCSLVESVLCMGVGVAMIAGYH